MLSASCHDKHLCLHSQIATSVTVQPPITTAINDTAAEIEYNIAGVGGNATKVIPC